MKKFFVMLLTLALCVDMVPHRSGSTVAKYIKMKNVPEIVKHTFKEVVRGA